MSSPGANIVDQIKNIETDVNSFLVLSANVLEMNSASNSGLELLTTFNNENYVVILLRNDFFILIIFYHSVNLITLPPTIGK